MYFESFYDKLVVGYQVNLVHFSFYFTNDDAFYTSNDVRFSFNIYLVIKCPTCQWNFCSFEFQKNYGINGFKLTMLMQKKCNNQVVTSWLSYVCILCNQSNNDDHDYI